MLLNFNHKLASSEGQGRRGRGGDEKWEDRTEAAWERELRSRRRERNKKKMLLKVNERKE